MSGPEEGPLGAIVRVIKGGNRIMEIRARCVNRDRNGQPQWECDLVGRIVVPAGLETIDFVIEGPVSTEIIGKQEV